MLFKGHTFLTVLLAVTGMGHFLCAQPEESDPSSPPPPPIERMFDPSSMETIQGTIREVEEVNPRGRPHPGVHLVVDSEDNTIEVILGPKWFFSQKGIAFKQGDPIMLKGSRVDFRGRPAIIATEVRMDGNQIQIRNPENGIPLWRKGPRDAGSWRQQDVNELNTPSR